MLSTEIRTTALLVLGLLTTLGVAPQDPAPSPPGPHPARLVIEETARTVEAILLDEESSMAARQRAVMGEIRRTVDARFVSRLVLAENYARFSQTQLREFEDEFLRHVLYSYWSAAHRFERFEVQGDKARGKRERIVMTRLHTAKDSSRLDYRLRKPRSKDGEWRIIDIMPDGISIVTTFRDQFASLLAEGSPESVLKLLRKKNAKAEAGAV